MAHATTHNFPLFLSFYISGIYYPHLFVYGLIAAMSEGLTRVYSLSVCRFNKSIGLISTTLNPSRSSVTGLSGPNDNKQIYHLESL